MRTITALLGIGLLAWSMGAAAPAASQPASGTEEAASNAARLDGVVFLPDRGTLYALVSELQDAFKSGEVPDSPEAEAVRQLPDGTPAVRLRALADHGFQVGWDREQKEAWVARDGRRVRVRKGYRTVMDGVTFADAPGTLLAAVRDLGQALGTRVRWDAGSQRAMLLGWEIPEDAQRKMVDGSRLVKVSALHGWGAEIEWREEANAARVSRDEHVTWVRLGPKRVEISLDEQRLKAWQGDLLVLDTRISSGRAGQETPTGEFRAGPLKTEMLISRKYNNAEMPWSVQIQGDIVIHGYQSVPPRAASHGCVRLPLTGNNPARWFYEWVDVGTPIQIADGWPGGSPG